MHRLRIAVAHTLAAALALSAAPARAQAVATAAYERGPRFLLATATELVPVDVSRTRTLARRLSLQLEGATLKEALEAIAAQSGLVLAYSDDVVPLGNRVHLRAEAVTAAAALTDVLFDAGVDVVFKTDGSAALVKRRAPRIGSVSGQVTDAQTGQGLESVEVLLQGTRWRALTSADGRYRLADVAAGDYTLVARRIGYGRQTRPITVATDQDLNLDLALAPAATELEELVSVGTVVPTEVKALPSPVSVITAKDIEQQQLRRTDQLFRIFVPSAVAWDLGESPEQTAITIRGASSFTGGTGVKVFVDGVEVANTTFTLIDPTSIERVEIIRGPEAATIYGPGAIGGVMQVFTKKGDPARARPEYEAQASAGMVESEFKNGSALRQDYRAAIRGGGGSYGYNVGASYGRTGEWLPEFRLRTPSVFGGAQLTQGPVQVEISGRYFGTDQNIPNSPRLVAAGLESPAPRYEERHYHQSTLGAHVGYTPVTWWHHNLTVGVDAFDGSQYNTRPRLLTPDDTLLQVVNRESSKKSIAYNTSVTLPTASRISAVVTAGFDHFSTDDNSFIAGLSDNFEGVLRPDPALPITAIRSPTSNTGFFGQTQLGLDDALFLTAGLRVDDNTVLGGEHPVSPRVGLAWSRPVGGVTVKLRSGYGEAIRAPEALSRLGLDLGFIRNLPNLDLRAERQKGVDAGVDLASGRGTVSVTYYHQIAQDLIQSVLIGVTPQGVPEFQDQNAGKVRNTGLELEAGMRLGAVQLTGNYAYTSSQVRELAVGYLGELLPGDYVLEIPKHSAGATAAFTLFQRTSIATGLTFVGKRTSYDYVALFNGTPARDAWVTYDPFFKLNLTVTQTLTPGISALLTVENLSNNNTGEEFDYLPSLGRISTVGLRARW
ncbi:MAG TPA: TonB-dependent receptor [Gemmatimonadales bacterium]|jgi:outer membrane receptor protein involved in Fe transport|nr:TonB-dependent receptor [Gemmatimonadales bacterium]